MLDPIPIPPPRVLASYARPLANYLNLETLPLHCHEILVCVAFYQFINVWFSPFISSRLFPQTYANLNRRTRVNWDVHVVSFVQSLLINAVAVWLMWNDEERKAMDWKEKIWGYTGATGVLVSMATGYFLWDLIMCLVHYDIFGIGLLAHAMSALLVYFLGYRPFVNYYAPNFILYELSSPFLNIHWFLDKLQMTGSNTQLVNGVFLMTSFFGSRLVWGVMNAYWVFSEIFRAMSYQRTPAGQAWLESAATKAAASMTADPAKAEVLRYVANKHIPIWMGGAYLVANTTLTLLNVYWFGQMIKTIRARFEPPFGTKQVPAKEVIMGRGLEYDGTKSVEVDSSEVRQRKPRRKA